MLAFHRWLGTWQTKIDVYLCSTNFYRDLFVQAGFPISKIIVMPHFVQQRNHYDIKKTQENYALFVGRLDPEKGIKTLLEAWRRLDFPLKIRGGGRLDEFSREYVRQHGINNIEFVRRMDEVELSDLISNAQFLIMPSEGFYETFGMVIIEAYSRGIPVIASNIGVTSELVSDKQTGLLFESGNPNDLVEKAQWMWNHPDEVSAMGKNGFNKYKEQFTEEKCYKTLIEVYERLIALK
jgi:glycosyltransferase involved in cell wall biosynthesis